MQDKIDSIIYRLALGFKTRFVAFGSSNTERRIHGLHWFDWLDLGLKQTYGRVHHCINAGLGGDTSQGLLKRFEEDVVLYQPHVVLVTIGGNDANPESGINASTYQANLQYLVALIRDLGAVPVLQTYYAADIHNLGQQHGDQFLQFMEIVRATALGTQTPLVDHHRRWEPLRLKHPDLYHQLMIDALHVNALGNMVLGLDLIRTFKAKLEQSQLDYCGEGIRYQRLLDKYSLTGELDL